MQAIAKRVKYDFALVKRQAVKYRDRELMISVGQAFPLDVQKLVNCQISQSPSHQFSIAIH